MLEKPKVRFQFNITFNPDYFIKILTAKIYWFRARRP